MSISCGDEPPTTSRHLTEAQRIVANAASGYRVDRTMNEQEFIVATSHRL